MSLKCANCGNEITDIAFTDPSGWFICKNCLIVYYPNLASRLPDRIKKMIFGETPPEPKPVEETEKPEESEEPDEEPNEKEEKNEPRIEVRVSFKKDKPRRRLGALMFFRSYDKLLETIKKVDAKYLRPDLIPVNAPDKLTIDLYSKVHEKILRVIVWGESDDEEKYRDFIERLFEREVREIVLAKPDNYKLVKCFHVGHYRLDSFLASTQIS